MKPTLGTTLRIARTNKNFGLREFAEQLEKSPSWLLKVERDLEKPSFETLQEICEKLEIALDDAVFLSLNPRAIGLAMMDLDALVRKGQLFKGVVVTMTYMGGYYCEFEDYNGSLVKSDAKDGILAAIGDAKTKLTQLQRLKRMASW